MKYLVILLALIFSQGALAQEQEDPLKSYLVAKKPTKDFQIINENCAIIIEMRDENIEEKKKEGEENFYTAADDYMFYQASALEFLVKKKTKIVTPKVRYLIFVMTDGKEIYLDTKAMGWKWILFSPESQPKVTYPANMENDYKEYFFSSVVNFN